MKKDVEKTWRESNVVSFDERGVVTISIDGVPLKGVTEISVDQDVRQSHAGIAYVTLEMHVSTKANPIEHGPGEVIYDEPDENMKRDKKELEYKIKEMLIQFQSKHWLDIHQISIDQFESPSKYDPCQKNIEKVNIELV